MTILESSTNPTYAQSPAIAATKHWLENAVIGLNLCPFAKAVHVKKQIRYALSDANTEEALREDLIAELQALKSANATDVDTTLLIHPYVLNDFFDYNEFLAIADTTLDELKLEGEFQIASFHPQYQFADATADDITNYTNRSPYPVLHLLREASIDRATAAFPDASDIFNANMETMRKLGRDGWSALLASSPHFVDRSTN